MYVYGAPQYVLTENGLQFAAKFFDTVQALLGIRHYLTTTYLPQTNGQARRCIKTIIHRLRHYVEEPQRHWDDFLQPLTYAYNIQVPQSTEPTPFGVVWTRQPPGLIFAGTAPQAAGVAPKDGSTPVQYKRATLRKLSDVLDRAQIKLTAAQRRYKDELDKRVQFPPVIQEGEKINVDRPLRTYRATERRDRDGHGLGEDDMSVKLLPKTEGPFESAKPRTRPSPWSKAGYPWGSVSTASNRCHEVWGTGRGPPVAHPPRPN